MLNGEPIVIPSRARRFSAITDGNFFFAII